ncbi:MAG: hypothetical protein R2757_03105 [Draconibacterium sp.]
MARRKCSDYSGREDIDILRVATSKPGTDMAAVVHISDDGTKATFDPSNGFMKFAGGKEIFHPIR